ncbi:MAG: hypothetical protein IPJ66_11565 [Bacteroidetes bacterium]|nr:hypothetical protein [Bacteroidota bacterium]
MEVFTNKEIMLMCDSFNSIEIDSEFSQKAQLFFVFDEGDHLFKKWNVDEELLRKKIEYIDEGQAKIITRAILNFLGRCDYEQLAKIFLDKALLDEDYEFASNIRDGKFSARNLQAKLTNLNQSKLIDDIERKKPDQ